MAKKGKKLDIRDNEGKVIGSANAEYYKLDEPSYFKAYMKDLMKVLKISDSNYIVLMSLLSRMDYNNQVNIYPLLRKDIAEEVGFKQVGSLNNSISALCRVGILKKLQTGSYLINPNYFARGSWEDIKKIQSTITYDDSGRIIIVEFEKKVSPEISMPDGDIDLLPKNN